MGGGWAVTITLNLPWLHTLPVQALLDTLPGLWRVGAHENGRRIVQRVRPAPAMVLDWEYLPVEGFADYHRRMAEVVQTIAETCADPVAYLAALRDWRAP